MLDGYCSDTSRTVFVGEIKEEYKKIYNIVLEAQLKAIREIKNGMMCKEIDAISRDYIKSFGYDFNHALGHCVGKEVHEDPVISPKREDIIENDMVFTIEPGIYIENRFGVRIEDTVLLRNGKVETLSNASKEIINSNKSKNQTIPNIPRRMKEILTNVRNGILSIVTDKEKAKLLETFLEKVSKASLFHNTEK